MLLPTSIVVPQLLSVILHFIQSPAKPRQTVLVVFDPNKIETTALITSLVQHARLTDVTWSMTTSWNGISAFDCTTIISFVFHPIRSSNRLYLAPKSVLFIGSDYKHFKNVSRWHRNEFVVIEHRPPEPTLSIFDLHEVQLQRRNTSQYLANTAHKSRHLTHVSIDVSNNLPDRFLVRRHSRWQSSSSLAYVGWLHYLFRIVGERMPLATIYSEPRQPAFDVHSDATDSFMFQDINTTVPFLLKQYKSCKIVDIHSFTV